MTRGGESDACDIVYGRQGGRVCLMNVTRNINEEPVGFVRDLWESGIQSGASGRGAWSADVLVLDR